MSKKKNRFFSIFFHKTKLFSFACLLFETHLWASMLTLTFVRLDLLQGTNLGLTYPRGVRTQAAQGLFVHTNSNVGSLGFTARYKPRTYEPWRHANPSGLGFICSQAELTCRPINVSQMILIAVVKRKSIAGETFPSEKRVFSLLCYNKNYSVKFDRKRIFFHETNKKNAIALIYIAS